MENLGPLLVTLPADPEKRSIMVLILHTQRTVRNFVPILEMILWLSEGDKKGETRDATSNEKIETLSSLALLS